MHSEAYRVLAGEALLYQRSAICALIVGVLAKVSEHLCSCCLSDNWMVCLKASKHPFGQAMYVLHGHGFPVHPKIARMRFVALVSGDKTILYQKSV